MEKKKRTPVIDLTDRYEDFIKYKVSTGIIAFDRVIGGGVPSGQLMEFFGGESTAKSRLVAKIIAKIQEARGVAVLADTEHAMHQGLIDLTGVDTKTLIYPGMKEEKGKKVSKIGSVEDIYQGIEDTALIIRPKYPDKPVAFIWDSIAATPGHEDLIKDIGRNEAGMRRAKLIGEGLQKYISLIYESQIIVIFVNQIRDKMNVMFGDKTSTPGGRAIKHLASLRIGMKLMGKIKDDKTGEQVGTHLQLWVRKSRVCPPFGIVNFEMPVYEPISKYAGLLDYMERHGEVEKIGKDKYKFTEEKEEWKGKGFEEAYEKRRKRKNEKKSLSCNSRRIF